MPIYLLKCPDCGHEFQSLVLNGARIPEIWVCSECGSRAVKPIAERSSDFHPLEKPHGKGCPCCGG
jgi:predicted nucleic acid-binding Zn ribbon protein